MSWATLGIGALIGGAFVAGMAFMYGVLGWNNMLRQTPRERP